MSSRSTARVNARKNARPFACALPAALVVVLALTVSGAGRACAAQPSAADLQRAYAILHAARSSCLPIWIRSRKLEL